MSLLGPLILDAERWKVYLHKNQFYFGRGVVVLKRQSSSLADLTDEDWMDFKCLVGIIEKTGKHCFNADLVNWFCFMNHAFKKDPPHPQTHWQFLLRFKDTITVEGMNWEDKEFSKVIDFNKKRELTKNQIDSLGKLWCKHISVASLL